MNNFLLRDYRWIEDLIQTTCDNFVSKLKHATNVGGEVENLERELYLWSSYCKLCNIAKVCCYFNKSKPFSNN